MRHRRAGSAMRHRRVGAAALAGAMAAAAFWAPAPLRADDVVLASTAEALVATVDIGGAGLTLPTGIARGQVAGADAQASANLVDYAIVATLLGVLVGEGTDFPGPVKATTDGPADAQRTTTLPGVAPVPPVVLGPVGTGASHEEAHVGEGPTAGARTEVAPLRVAGLATLAGASSVIDLRPEHAAANATIAELRIADAVVLRDVEWFADARAGQAPAAGFRVGGLVIGGVPLPVPAASTFDPALVNLVLNAVGVYVDAPVVTVEGPKASVSPLVIRYGRSPVAQATIGSVYASLGPALIELFNAIQAGTPEAGYLLYVSNIVLASLAGLGDLSVRLGGASASWEQRSFTDPASTPTPDGAAPAGVTPGAGPAAPAPAATAGSGAAAPSDPVAAPVAGPGFAPRPAATRRLADRVPDGLVLGLALAGVVGSVLLLAGRRRRGGATGATAAEATA